MSCCYQNGAEKENNVKIEECRDLFADGRDSDMTRGLKTALSSQSCQGIYYVANTSVWQLLPSHAVKVVWKMFRPSPMEGADLGQAGLEIHLSIVLSKPETSRVYIFKWLYRRKTICAVIVMSIAKE